MWDFVNYIAEYSFIVLTFKLIHCEKEEKNQGFVLIFISQTYVVFIRIQDSKKCKTSWKLPWNRENSYNQMPLSSKFIHCLPHRKHTVSHSYIATWGY